MGDGPDRQVEVRDAATVVLVRDGECGLEVLLMRRHRGHVFMADRWVFPGGRVDARDCDAGIEAYCAAGWEVERAAQRLEEEEAAARGVVVAALREVFEETGILLVREEDEGEVQELFSRDSERWQAWRRKLDEGSASMVEFLAALSQEAGTRVCLDPAALRYYARWVTPDFEVRRYDTRFFVARAPAGQAMQADARELVEGRWFTPADAIEAYRSGEILLAPPTLCVLEDLQKYTGEDAVEALLADADRLPVPAIMPQLLARPAGEEVVLLLPGDVEYPNEVNMLERCDGAMRSVETKERSGVTRVVQREGQWWTERA